MKRILVILFTLTMLVGMNAPAFTETAFAKEDPAPGYSLFVVIDGLNTGQTEASSVTHVQSETPYYVLPENPYTVKEGFKFIGYYCQATNKYYQTGESIPLEDFTLRGDEYWIELSTAYSDPEKPDIEYKDVYTYTAKLKIMSPTNKDSVADTLTCSYDPTKDTNIGTAEYKYGMRTVLGRIQNLGVSPAGYRSAVTGNVFELGDTYDLDKLPEAEFVGTELRDISETEGERIHKYEITDNLVPLYSFYGATGAFLDPLYECAIKYYVPDPISNSKDLDAPVSYAGTQIVSDITMEELTASDYTIELDDAPAYAGYIFNGYSLLNETEVTVPDDHQIVPNENEFQNDAIGKLRLSIKLHYSIDPDYTPGIQKHISYDSNGGSLPITGAAPADENLYAVGAPFKVMGQGTLQIAGYEFAGWNTKADGSGSLYREDDIAVMTEAAILYAQWKPEGSVQVTLDGNGGAFGKETSKDIYAMPSAALDEANGYAEPVRDGYDFIGWAKTSDAASPDITTAPNTDKTTLYAVWSRKTNIKVTFDAGNGQTPTEETGAFEAPLTVPADPSRTGYSFGEWNTKADGSGSAPADPAVFPGRDTTYYAQWIPDEITVSFSAGEGGKIISGSTEAKLHTGETLRDVSGFIFPEIQEDYPYTFIGWRSNSGKLYETESGTAQNVINHEFTGEQNPEIFTAEYSKLRQTEITFDYKGGLDSDGKSFKTFKDYEYAGFDESLVPVPVRTGYKFKGWDAEIPAEYPYLDDAVTLNALWEKTKHTVTFEMNGHGSAPAKQTIYYGDKVKRPADPKAAGYTFGGWYKDAACTKAWNFDKNSITADTVLYAKWDKTAEKAAVLLLRASNGDKGKVKLTWNKVKGAKKYVIYAGKCSKPIVKLKKLKTVKGTGCLIKTISGKKLKAHRTYKFYVVAYTAHGKVKSRMLHFITANTNGIYGNVTYIKAGKTSVQLKVGESTKLKAATKVYKGKKHIRTSHGTALKYFSNSPSIAAVSSKGMVTAKRAGTATIYIQDIGGRYCRTVVKVVNE